MSTALRVAVDALGGDYGPAVVVEGCLRACRELGVEVLLVGPEDLVRAELQKAGGGSSLQVSVAHAPDAIGMGEAVSRATLKKRSSIHLGLEKVRDGEAAAFFSAGNTAACWTIAKLVLGTLEEVDRPALAAVVPNLKGFTVLLDVGANVHCTPRNLEEFAVMGNAYTRDVFQVAHPRVGLMSLGEEETKGTDLTKEVLEVLKGSTLNFVGNVEGHDIYTGDVDVIVMDGFTGNVALKTSESLAESILALLREELQRTPVRKLGAWLARGAFRAVKARIDAAEYGGAPLLGVKGCCVVGHGRSSAHAVRQGIKVAAEFAKSGVNAAIEAELRGLSARKDEKRPA